MEVRRDIKCSNTYTIGTKVNAPENGNTLLHIAFLKNNDSQSLKSLIAGIGEEKAAIMARTVNNDGQLPMDFLIESRLKNNNEIIKILYGLMHKQKILPIQKMLDINDILSRYPKLDKQLYDNLISACSIVNETRKIINKSNTHPQANNYERRDYVELIHHINRLRKKTYLCSEVPFPPVSHLEYDADLIRQNKVGNCHEFSIIAMSILRKKSDQLLFGDIYQIKKGDHVFLVIDNEVTSSSRKAKKRWSLNAVVCDAWAGEVYPAYEIPLRMAAYCQYEIDNEKVLNTLIPINTSVHSLIRFFSSDNISNLDIETSKKRKRTAYEELGMFAKKQKINPPESKRKCSPDETLYFIRGL